MAGFGIGGVDTSATTRARNGSLEVSVQILKAKQGFTVRKLKTINDYSIY
jgi:hypothetical protein